MTRIDMAASEWHKLIKPVIPHASADKELPELAAIRIELTDLAAYAVATDRYTLAAERFRFEPGAVAWDGEPPVHVRVAEAKASLGLFPFSKDDDPPLRIVIERAPVPIQVAGMQRSVHHLAVTVESADGTRVVLHDARDPSRDAHAGWKRRLAAALTRPPGQPIDGLDLYTAHLSRWDAAARRGERLTIWTGPEPGDALLVTVEQHFAGLWSIPRYLESAGKLREDTPWLEELALAGSMEAGDDN